MKHNFLVQTIKAITIVLSAIAFTSPQVLSTTSETLIQDSEQVAPNIEDIARFVTVRIFTNSGAGSGAIIDHQGQTYTVLTGQHVVNSSESDRFAVLTPDGETHPARIKQVERFQGIDLALMQFDSQTKYQVAIFGNLTNISVGEPVYIAGFANYQNIGLKAMKSTRQLGVKAFKVTPGKVSMLLSAQSLQRGYQLGYTNYTVTGMSGGPVLDRTGKLIGIHGRGKYPLAGINAFRLTDGTIPSPEWFQQMYALSWAVPISIYQKEMGLPVTPVSRNNSTVIQTVIGDDRSGSPTKQPRI